MMGVLAALALADGAMAPKTGEAPATLERQDMGQLLSVRRVYVDRLTGGRPRRRCAI